MPRRRPRRPTGTPTRRSGSTWRRAFRAEKLVLGVAFYGRGFAGVKPENDGLNQPYKRYEAEHPYAELVGKLIDRQGFFRRWDERAKAHVPVERRDARPSSPTKIRESIRAKAEYVREHSASAAVMFWELSQDRNDELLDAIVTSFKGDSRPLKGTVPFKSDCPL